MSILSQQKRRGFTLLELLLVVGIAAVLIVAGISTFSIVTKTNNINETVRLINLIIEQTRRLYNGSNYDANAEALLINTGNVPAKFINGTDIVSPYNRTAGGVVIAVEGTNTFDVRIAGVQRRDHIELAQNFPIAGNIVRVIACNVTFNAANPATIASLSTACAANPTTLNTFRVLSN